MVVFLLKFVILLEIKILYYKINFLILLVYILLWLKLGKILVKYLCNCLEVVFFIFIEVIVVFFFFFIECNMLCKGIFELFVYIVIFVREIIFLLL